MRAQHYTDSELIIQLQRDDVDAFDRIYRKYHAAIYQNIFKLLKDPDDAENILQEVFLALWLNRAILDANRPVANWLFVVSYNKAITQLKKNLKQTLAFREMEEHYPYNDGPDMILKEARFQLINEAFLNLSPQKQKVFDLCKLQGKTYEQTARELNLSKHTVKEYLSHAVKSIKEYVDHHPDNRMAGIYLMIVVKAIMSK